MTVAGTSDGATVASVTDRDPDDPARTPAAGPEQAAAEQAAAENQPAEVEVEREPASAQAAPVEPETDTDPTGSTGEPPVVAREPVAAVEAVSAAGRPESVRRPGPAGQVGPLAAGWRDPAARRENVRRALARLDQLDRAALPPSGRVLNRIAVAVGAWGRAGVDTAYRLAERLRPRPLLAGRMRRGTTVTVTVAVTVVAMGALASFAHGWVGGRPAGTTNQVGGLRATGATPLGSGSLSPTAEYIVGARRRLAALTWANGETSTYAVVSLPGYRTPTQLTRLLSSYEVVQVFYRVPPQGQIMRAQVREPGDVNRAFDNAAVAAERRADAAGTAPAIAVHARDDVRALRARCSCLFSAVVRAPVNRLASLSSSPEVRVVDPASPGTKPDRTTFVAIPPEQQ